MSRTGWLKKLLLKEIPPGVVTIEVVDDNHVKVVTSVGGHTSETVAVVFHDHELEDLRSDSESDRQRELVAPDE